MKTLVSIAPCRLNRDRPVGFTLVELLVVIVIISVLAALLLPALGKSLAHAHKIQCLSELHQWGLAFNMYVNDNEDRIPREGYDPNGGVIWNTWVQVRRVEDTWYNGLPPYMSKPAASNYVLPSKRAGFYEKGSFFQCPSAKFPSDVHDPAYQIAIFSRA
jgi:prepilin-type N-terminal cleavage/methylation domain-containing protein